MSVTLNYEDAIHLDAEALAEAGIGESYERLLPTLRRYTAHPLTVVEERDDNAPSYSIRCGDKTIAIYGPEIEATRNSWGDATVAFFTIVNDQLAGSTHRFYAING